MLLFQRSRLFTRRIHIGAATLPRASRKTTDRLRENEDAHFVAEGAFSACVGVADGVGSWRERGVDAGKYARALMSSIAGEWNSRAGDSPSAGAMLERAWRATAEQRVVGSATATVMVLDARQGVLDVAFVGDCAVMVWRRVTRDGGSPALWHVVGRTEPQLRSFDMPFQLGWAPSPSDSALFDAPSAREVLRFAVLPGDIAVVASDGITDNLEMADIASILGEWGGATAALMGSADELARRIVQRARDASLDHTRDGPFARLAKDNDVCWRQGGRPDDATAVVVVVP